MVELVRKIKKAIINYSEQSWDLKTAHLVPSDQKSFLRHKAWKLKWVFKYFKRKLYMRLIRQHNKELSYIPKAAKAILWVNLSAPSLGDSLMDLSSRQLLREYDVDLLTDGKNAQIYQKDPFFNKCFIDPSDLVNRKYDLVILDSYSPRILKIKSRILSEVPFVGLWGFLNGFEVHRTLYSFYRMQFLLQNTDPLPKLQPIMRRPDFFDAGLCPDKKKVAIVIGAEWDYRRYAKWAEVIDGILHEHAGAVEILLVGSSNGLAESEVISSRFLQCKNFVGTCTLEETSSLIDQSDMLVAADGGLWHIACALNKPSVVLFADTKLFDGNDRRVTRETKDICCEVLYAENSVSQIAVGQVLEAFQLLISKIQS